jgi:hypothetical protein
MASSPQQAATPWTPDFWAIPEDRPDLKSVATLFSATLGTCKICGWRPSADGGETRDEHLARHCWQITAAGQRARNAEDQRKADDAALEREVMSAGRVVVRRKLGLMLWRLYDRGRSPAQIARDVRIPRWLAERALTLPRRRDGRILKRQAVLHLRWLGLLAGEIAERLGMSLHDVDRYLAEVDQSEWLERCCPQDGNRCLCSGAPRIAFPTSPRTAPQARLDWRDEQDLIRGTCSVVREIPSERVRRGKSRVARLTLPGLPARWRAAGPRTPASEREDAVSIHGTGTLRLRPAALISQVPGRGVTRRHGRLLRPR